MKVQYPYTSNKNPSQLTTCKPMCAQTRRVYLRRFRDNHVCKSKGNISIASKHSIVFKHRGFE